MMIKYVTRRLLQSVPILFGITILSFILMTQAPGGPTSALSINPQLTPAQRRQMEEQLGVNDSVFEQYIRWLIGDTWQKKDLDGDGVKESSGNRKGVLRGDFGNSFAARRPVKDLMLERIPATLELSISALALALLVGLPVGILAAVQRGGIFDNVTRVFAVIFNAVPNFWLGLMLILLFGSVLGVLPMGSRCPLSLLGGCKPIYARLHHLLLPTFALATSFMAGYSRYMRASMLDVINQDYVRTARAKGLSNRTVWFKHSARNALIPIATFLGPAFTGLLSGAVITETIFSWPGIGRLAVNAVQQQDYPVVMATVLAGAIATILGYILSDVLYALIDPRIRLQ